jgi:hypothetical protein
LVETVPILSVELVCSTLILRPTATECYARKLQINVGHLLRYAHFVALLDYGWSLGRQYGLINSSGEPLPDPPYTGPL